MSNSVLPLHYRSILGVALPMMVSGFIQSIVLITDSAFISRYSVEGFDAVGNAGLAYITFYMMLLGMSDGAQILMARRIGESRNDQLGRILNATWFVLGVLALLFFLVLTFVIPDLIEWYSKNKNVAMLQGQYLSYRSFALFFSMISLGFQSFYLAQGKSWVVLLAAVLTASTNVLFDYLLIFGVGGFPAMGVRGAAAASSLADGLGMVFLVGYTLLSSKNKTFGLFTTIRGIIIELKELLRVGFPLLLQGFSALFTWTLFFTWIEQMGQYQLTVSQNIRSIYFLAFVPIWGFAGTTKTYISQYIGAKRQVDLPKIQRRIQLLTFLFMLFSFHGAILYPETLIALINPHEQYFDESSAILRLVAGSIMLFALVSVYFQTIHGSGNTMVSMSIEVISVLVYTASVYLFIKILNFDIYHVWTVEYIYFGTMGMLSFLYLKFFQWNNKKI
ncbi:MAG: MATE family efflux transporter [Crocinitomicaceae bacterium]